MTRLDMYSHIRPHDVYLESPLLASMLDASISPLRNEVRHVTCGCPTWRLPGCMNLLHTPPESLL